MSEQLPVQSNDKPPKSKTKAFIVALILIAAGGILAYKLAFPQPVSPAATNALFKAQEKAVARPAPLVDAGPFSMEDLASLNALNEKAMDKEAVMVWVSKESGKIPKSTLGVLKGAWSTIRGKGVKLGMYRLQAGSPDLKNIGNQLALPAVLVLSKGKGMGNVTGEITQEKLLQALAASGRSGGCCPGGASPACPRPQ